MIPATNKGGAGFEPVPAGTYPARCYSMVHIGTVKEIIKGEEKIINKVRISWELPTELKVFKEENGEQPHVVSKEFNLSMNEKSTLRKFLEGWRGKGFTDDECKLFDVTVLIGKACLLSIIHKPSKDGSKVYAEISSVSTVPKGMTVPAQISPSFEFSYTNFSEEKLESLPSFLKDKIKTSEEYKFLKAPQETADAASAAMDPEPLHTDDLPF